jgi:ferritin-like metal-binding protein YciE
MIAIESRRAMPDAKLREVWLRELNCLHNAEHGILKTLPKLSQQAYSGELRAAFERCAMQAKMHVARLEEIFESLGAQAGDKPCKGIEGIITEAEELCGEHLPQPYGDTLLVTEAQRIAHYTIVGYRSAKSAAEILGNEFAVDLLDITYAEALDADRFLSEIAEHLTAGLRPREPELV